MSWNSIFQSRTAPPRFGWVPLLTAMALALFSFLQNARAAETSVLEGRIINTNGLAIPDAKVSIFYAVPRDGKSTICPTCYPDVGKTVTTDNQGSFRIPGVNSDLKFRLL